MHYQVAYGLFKYSSSSIAGSTDVKELEVNASQGAQNQILINSSETADGVRTPDSVMIPEIRSGG